MATALKEQKFVEGIRGCTDRIRQLREESVHGAVPTISMERAVLLTEAYQQYEGTCSIPVLRGKAFYYLMAHRTLYLGRGSLIVGEKGPKPWAAPTFPELCCHTLEDFDTLNSRERVFFRVTDEDKRIQRDVIIPYWKDRAMLTKMNGLLPRAWQKLFAAGMFTEFLQQRGPGHTVADGKIYWKGYGDFLRDIQERLASLDFNNDMDALEKRDEWEGMAWVCRGMILLGKRYAALARDMAAKEKDPAWRRDLLDIAAVCDVVPEHRPQTFRQAIQMYWFTHIGVTTEMNNWDAYSPGKFDQYLEPFYDRDLAEGRLTRDDAKELLEALWIQFNNQPAESGYYPQGKRDVYRFLQHQYRRPAVRRDLWRQRCKLSHPGSHGRHAPPPAELQRSDFPEDAGTLPAEGSGNLPQGLGPAGVL